ncbi:hypothetical protein LptCag_2483 [Leptospirillum ferriphilum]|uniref:Uncharacterized protein n=1 Tax=Leptospirillum ferriphilum TaxID=178606 RepID=A0A094X948_9BACT|nr:hypothetical protein LptCag_2483 [Leptospirillum ferriphilum]
MDNVLAFVGLSTMIRVFPAACAREVFETAPPFAPEEAFFVVDRLVVAFF